MITDRARTGSADAIVAAASAAARAGVDLVQVREPGLDGGPLFDLVVRVLDGVRSTRARVIVNDRLDVALAAGAHGVHLRGDSMPAPRVRRITPRGFLVGRSVHAAAEAIDAAAQGGIDYLIFGTVYPTTAKPGRTAAGAGALRDLAACTALPVLAIGGVTAARLDEIAGSGAAGVAAIGAFAAGGIDGARHFVGAARQAFRQAGR